MARIKRMKNNSALSVMVLLAVCVLLAATVFIISSVLPGFGGDSPQPEAVYIQKPEKTADLTMQQTAAPQPDDTEPVQTDDGMAEPENTYVQQMPEATKQPETEGMQTPDNESDKPLNGIVIGLDPGHQAHSNKEKEPQSPGSDVMKKKVSSGTRGVKSRVEEHAVNLAVGLLLRGMLEDAGATVDTNDGVVVDRNLITSRGAGHAIAFGLAIVSAASGEETARKVAKSIMLQ